MISNQTAIADFTIRDHVNAMKSRGSFPLAGLPAFLHEATHHWCFDSAVGLSLALLWVRTFRDLLMWNADVPGAEEALIRSKSRLFKYELASRLLRPLLEGLALFAEFDAFPGSAQFASIPLMWAWMLYAESPRDFQTDVKDILIASRLSARTVRRKTNVLASAFAVANGDGYLPGYLSVRSSSMIIMEASARLVDADFYLSYMKEFFFEDAGLVNLILDERMDDSEWAGRVIDYFRTRIRNSIASVNERVLEEFESKIAGDSNAVVECPVAEDFLLKGEFFRSPLCADAESIEIARRQINGALTDINRPLAEKFDWLRDVCLGLLIRRHLMCLGSYPTRVAINDSHRVVIHDDDGPIMAVQCRQAFEAQEGPGVLDFYVSPAHYYRAYAVSLGATLVSFATVSAENKMIEQQLSLSLLSSEVARATIATAITFLEKNKYDDLIHDVIQSRFVEEVESTYLTWSTIVVKSEWVNSVAPVLKKDGLWTITGESLDNLRGLALLGLCDSVRIGKSAKEQILAERGMDFDGIVDALKSASAKGGMALFRDQFTMI
jgi:hypothetical protein